MKPSIERKLREVASKIDFNDAGFSFRRLIEASMRLAEMTEANVASTFGFLLRSAVQQFANDVYHDVAVIYPNAVTEIASKRRSELYGGLYRPALPKQVDAGEPFQETTFKGFERELVNYKHGHIEAFERELFDDDQTGQVRQRASNMGEGFRIYEEIYVLARLFGAVAGNYDGVDVPASTYNSGQPFTVAIGNRANPYIRLSAASLEAAHVAIRSMNDPTGRKFLVTPTQLYVSPIDEFLAWTLVNSPNQGNLATSPFAMMVNPLQGRYSVFASPFIASKAWQIGDPKRGFVFQRRDPLEIVQENPQSGGSFLQETYKFRARERFEVDWIEPRFSYLGNDGSV